MKFEKSLILLSMQVLARHCSIMFRLSLDSHELFAQQKVYDDEMMKTCKCYVVEN